MIEINLCARDKTPGNRRSADDRLAQVQQFFQRHRGSEIVVSATAPGIDGMPAYFVRFHPAATPASFSVSDDGRLWVSAKTLPVGPGYHADLCDLLGQLAVECDLTWDEPDPALGTGDPTTYFQTGLFGRVQHTMIAWLRQSLKFHLDQPGPFGRALIWFPPDFAPVGEGSFYTMVGPRTCEWGRAVLDGDNARALNIFPWQAPERNCGYWLGRAATDMWLNVRWRAPIVERERRLLQSVVDALETAHRLDPSKPTLWHEWNEIRGFLGLASPPPGDPHLDPRHPSQIPFGYRRGDIIVCPLGVTSWHLKVPGSLAIEPVENIWRAFDLQRQITFEAFTRKGDRPIHETIHALLQHNRPDRCHVLARLPHPPSHVVGEAEFLELTVPAPFRWRLLAICGAGREIARYTIDLADPALRDWAIATWQSIAFAHVAQY